MPYRQAREIAELNQLSGLRSVGGQVAERLVQRQQLVVFVRLGDVQSVQSDALAIAAVLGPAFAAGVVDEDATHRLGGSGEEMAATVPVLVRIVADQTQIGFVDQSGGVERLSRLLVGEFLGGQKTQFVVDQR